VVAKIPHRFDFNRTVDVRRAISLHLRAALDEREQEDVIFSDTFGQADRSMIWS
jgi:hypothetical protein